jgi:DNA-3-methyladenine glycosylase
MILAGRWVYKSLGYVLHVQVLGKEFYNRKTDKVARDLLGKILIRRLDYELLGGVIVETEAYFGSEDPASRAFYGKKQYNRVMFEDPGHLFIYNVHRYWMLNFVAHDNGVGGILIRAIEPTMGIKTMKRNRPVINHRKLTNGPGKLTIALCVNKSLNGENVTSDSQAIYVLENQFEYKFGSSHRIGVTKDLPKHYRFFVLGNQFVSNY